MTRAIILLNVFVLTLFISCDFGRTSSKERLEKACDVIIPNDNVVIEDEYQDMMQDYVVIYKFKLSQTSLNKFIASIKKSKYYNPKASRLSFYSEELSLPVDSTRSVWWKSNEGYRFHKSGEKIPVYSVLVDTVSMTVDYKEID